MTILDWLLGALFPETNSRSTDDGDTTDGRAQIDPWG